MCDFVKQNENVFSATAMHSLQKKYISVYVLMELNLLIELLKNVLHMDTFSVYHATKRVIPTLATIAQCLHRHWNWQQPSHSY